MHNDATRGASLVRVAVEAGKTAGAGIGWVTAATNAEARGIPFGDRASLR